MSRTPVETLPVQVTVAVGAAPDTVLQGGKGGTTCARVCGGVTSSNAPTATDAKSEARRWRVTFSSLPQRCGALPVSTKSMFSNH